MKRKRIFTILVLVLLTCALSTTAFAIDESEVESAIAASSQEEVAGNIFIWFLCAIGFLKVSQKIDSFMASLGVNVGRTGGSMLAELMVAGRGIATAAGACSVAVFFQNVGQMRNRYPDDQWQEILGACDSTVFLGCTDMLTAEYFSDRIGTASVEVEGTMRELNTMHITNYTPRFRKTNSLGRRQLLTPDEVLRLPPDQVLIFIRGQKVMRAKRYDYSLHPDYKKLKSRKAILHEPDWKTSQASSVSATGPSPCFLQRGAGCLFGQPLHQRGI